MPDVPEIRPMRLEDDVAVHELQNVTFADLERRFHAPPSPPAPLEVALIRIRQLIGTDPGGAWVAEEAGEVVGAALALEREGLWGLSLLVVSPALQSQGVGRELLERTLELRRAAASAARSSSPRPTTARCAPTRGPASPRTPASTRRGSPR